MVDVHLTVPSPDRPEPRDSGVHRPRPRAPVDGVGLLGVCARGLGARNLVQRAGFLEAWKPTVPSSFPSTCFLN